MAKLCKEELTAEKKKIKTLHFEQNNNRKDICSMPIGQVLYCLWGGLTLVTLSGHTVNPGLPFSVNALINSVSKFCLCSATNLKFWRVGAYNQKTESMHKLYTGQLNY